MTLLSSEKVHFRRKHGPRNSWLFAFFHRWRNTTKSFSTHSVQAKLSYWVTYLCPKNFPSFWRLVFLKRYWRHGWDNFFFYDPMVDWIILASKLPLLQPFCSIRLWHDKNCRRRDLSVWEVWCCVMGLQWDMLGNPNSGWSEVTYAYLERRGDFPRKKPCSIKVSFFSSFISFFSSFISFQGWNMRPWNKVKSHMQPATRFKQTRWLPPWHMYLCSKRTTIFRMLHFGHSQDHRSWSHGTTKQTRMFWTEAFVVSKGSGSIASGKGWW